MSRRSTPAEVRALALLAYGTAAACLFGAIFPLASRSSTGLLAAFAVTGVVVGTGLLAAGPAVSKRALGLGTALIIVLISVLIANAATPGGATLEGYAYVWLTVYSSLFLSRRAMRAHAALITVGFGVGLLVSGLDGMLVAWVLVCGTVWVFGHALSALAERVRLQAETDHVTGLLNRHAFVAAAEREHELAARTGADLSVVVIDLDGFKAINDRDGHAAGDRLLADLGSAWQYVLRPADVLARHGGDEFAVLLPATDAAGARHVVTRLRAAHPMRWSAGVAAWEGGESLDAVLARADARLYEAKRDKAPEAQRV